MVKKLVAYCNSTRCAKYSHSVNNSSWEPKNVSHATIDCPDCGCALQWRSKRKVHSVVSKHRKRQTSAMNIEYIV